MSGQVDFLVAETTSALRLIEDAGITGLRYAGPLGEAPVRLSLAVSPNIKGLRGIIDTGLGSITQAEAATIRRQWVGAPLQGGVNLHEVLRWASALALLMAVGALAFYLWSLRLRREVTRQTRLYAALTRCNEAIARSVSATDLFPKVCQIAVELGGMQMAWIGLIDTNTSLLRPVGWFGEQARAYLHGIEISVDTDHPKGKGLTGLAVQENQPIWCQDARHDERVAVWRSIRAKLGIDWRAMAVLPLRRQGVTIGTLSLNAGSVNAFDEKSQRLLVDMAADISQALDHFARAQALLEVTKQLQTIANHAPVLIAQCDQNFRYRFVNQGYAALFKSTPQELLGQNVQQVVGEATFAQAKPHMDGALAGKPGQYDLELPDKVLGMRTLQVIYAPERNPGGQVIGFIAAVLDITQRKRAEAEARISALAYQSLFESSRDAITLTSMEGHFVGGNPAAFELFGCRDREEFVSLSVADLSPERQPDGRLSAEKAKEIVHRALQEGAHAFEWVHRRRDGTDFVTEILITPAESNGVPIVQASLRDITERIRSREALERSASELTALNALAKQVSASLELTQVTRAVLDQSLLAIKPDLAMLFLHEGGGLHLLGSSSEVGALQSSSLAVQRLGECLCGVAAAQSGPLYVLDVPNDPRCGGEDGKQAGLQAFAALPLRRGDLVIGVLGVAAVNARDFESQATFLETLAEQASAGLQNAQLHRQIERHVAELEQRVVERTTELATAKARAEGADEMKSAFLATMSHELRTPLNSIIGFTGVLMQKLPGPLNAEQEKQLGMVRNSGRHLLALINDVLDISKIEAGEMNLAHVEFDLHALLEKIGPMFAPQVKRRGLAFKQEVGANEMMMVGDARRVEQVLNNLLSNALKFTAQGHIEIACVRSGAYWAISVTDTGRGIKPEDMGKLFRPFGQIDSGHPGLHDATGLGLALSKQLVEAMGGRIEASSVAGQGSCFRFTLQAKE
ncbi:GAF domain-containing protein [Rhodoferax sp. PAMC 29310]|uniref:GAF domain-containing protein n=1 Tax=Rhodoferax sp. PAMC 29310 TaxID=2822760 RepID=UPI001B32659B|nr:GAF domain-containing protein [Rhodoferax sp. PAMC 29310]